ncbi:hypothetical protein [Nocardia grenadensis]|uniref:hypothetical protein n=1 Tax=Nocardia grenadensis TaxID=931537 RepID=UPI003D70BB72
MDKRDIARILAPGAYLGEDRQYKYLGQQIERQVNRAWAELHAGRLLDAGYVVGKIPGLLDLGEVRSALRYRGHDDASEIARVLHFDLPEYGYAVVELL